MATKNATTTSELPRTGMLRRTDFQKFTGFKSKQSIYDHIKAGTFPPGHSIGPTLRVWRAEDIWQWLDSRFPRQEFLNKKIRNS